ncbi:MAG: hypothetical protein K2P81_14690 [Bacteriovoracaceae bacterium]|nr:hypothetical protein [Bacteriovoracaceae bacterium]
MSGTKNVKEIKEPTRRYYTAEQKIRIVLEGLRGEITVATFSPPRNQSQM